MLKIKVTTSLICIELECLDVQSQPLILQTVVKVIDKATQATKDMENKIGVN